MNQVSGSVNSMLLCPAGCQLLSPAKSKLGLVEILKAGIYASTIFVYREIYEYAYTRIQIKPYTVWFLNWITPSRSFHYLNLLEWKMLWETRSCKYRYSNYFTRTILRRSTRFLGKIKTIVNCSYLLPIPVLPNLHLLLRIYRIPDHSVCISKTLWL